MGKISALLNESLDNLVQIGTDTIDVIDKSLPDFELDKKQLLLSSYFLNEEDFILSDDSKFIYYKTHTHSEFYQVVISFTDETVNVIVECGFTNDIKVITLRCVQILIRYQDSVDSLKSNIIAVIKRAMLA